MVDILRKFKEQQQIMPFGKYEGEPLDNIPASYKEWLLTEADLSNYPELREYLEEHEMGIYSEAAEERNLDNASYMRFY